MHAHALVLCSFICAIWFNLTGSRRFSLRITATHNATMMACGPSWAGSSRVEPPNACMPRCRTVAHGCVAHSMRLPRVGVGYQTPRPSCSVGAVPPVVGFHPQRYIVECQEWARGDRWQRSQGWCETHPTSALVGSSWPDNARTHLGGREGEGKGEGGGRGRMPLGWSFDPWQTLQSSATVLAHSTGYRSNDADGFAMQRPSQREVVVMRAYTHEPGLEDPPSGYTLGDKGKVVMQERHAKSVAVASVS
jgi:hypothetical protein